MPRFRFIIEYHGGPYVGWQRQENGRSVQQVLEEALSTIEPVQPTLFGAGRTDSGVHAIAQVAHVDLVREWAPDRLYAALNGQLVSESISILATQQVPAGFHARFDAIERSYIYRIDCRRAPLALDRGFAWHRPRNLNADAMADAASRVVGHHDFTTFRSAHCQAESPFRTLHLLDVRRHGERIEIRASAPSFLHRQVRSIVGSLEQVGRGRWTPGDLHRALKARDRAACGPVAPPDGLYLESVRYK